MIKARQRARFALATLSVVGLLVSACTGTPGSSPGATTPGDQSQPPATKTIKIGVEGPFSGPNARTGEEMRGSVELAMEAINYQVGDYKIELVYIDDQSDPEKGSRAYEEAVVGQGIVAGILGWHSSVAVAQMEITAKHKVPHFFAMGATGVVNEKFASDQAKYGYWTAKGWPDPPKLSIAYVTALEEAIAAGKISMPDKRVAIYGEDTDWGRSFGAGLKGQFTDAGWTVVSEDFFSLEQTEFTSLLTRYKDANIPVLAGTSTIAPSISAFIKQAQDVGLESLIVADGLGWVGEWYDLTGNAADYVLDQIPGWTTPEAVAFRDEFTAKKGIEPSPSAAGLSYDFTNFFIKILETTLADSGELTSATIYKTAQDKLWTGQLTYDDGIIMASYKYSTETIPDPVIGQDGYIFPVLQYFGGEATVIWPEDWKTGDLQAKP